MESHWSDTLSNASLFGLDRIVVLGTTGAGKTTTARQIAASTGLPLIELDEIRWQPNWIETPDHQFKELVARELSGDRWVVDGNYGIVRDIIWPRTQAFIWLDYTFPRILWQLITRTVRRCASKEHLWSGNVETWRKSFLSTDSIILWAFESHPKKKAKYPRLLEEEQKKGKKIFRIKSPARLQLRLGTYECSDNFSIESKGGLSTIVKNGP